MRYIIAALIAALLIALYFVTEGYTYVQHQSATQKPWSAAFALLEKSDIPSQRVHGAASLFPLPNTNTMLIIDENRSQLSSNQINELHQWVKSGGRLLIAARLLYYFDPEEIPECDDDEFDDCSENDSADSATSNEENDAGSQRINYAETGYDEQDLLDNDPLLYSFGISAWNVPRDNVWGPMFGFESENWFELKLSHQLLENCISKGKGKAEEEEEEEDQYCTDILCGDSEQGLTYSLSTISGELRQFGFDPEDKLMHIDQFSDEENEEFDPTTPLTETRLELEADNAFGTQLLRVSYGDGDVIALTSLDIWTNNQLAYLDHAWLLIAIADYADEVWWVHNIDMPPLLAWMWQRSWPLFIATAVLLVLFLWMKMPRRGPLLQTHHRYSRDFLNHLHASGFFLQRTGQVSALLEPLRQQVQRKMANHPGGDKAPDCYNVAANLTGLSVPVITQAMTNTPDSDQSLTVMVHTLQTLRSRL